MNVSPSPSHARWAWIAVLLWLLLVSAAAVIHHRSLARLQAGVATQAHEGRLITLERKLAELGQQPAPLSQMSFAAVREAWETRLGQVEQSVADRAAASDIATLQERLAQAEARIEKARALAAAALTHHKPIKPAKPRPVEPPFQVLGVELRGGERFVSIAPIGIPSLPQARLLRVGEAEAGWRLEALEAHVAVFRADAQTRRLPLPEVPTP